MIHYGGMADVDLQLTPEQIEVVETEILDFFAVTQDEVAAELGIDPLWQVERGRWRPDLR